MFLAVTAVKDVTVLTLAGVLNEECLRAAVGVLGEAGPRVVHLDLGAVCRPTAEGLGVLVTLNKALRARGGRLVLFNVPAFTFEVLQKTRLVDVLDVRLAGPSRLPHTPSA